MALNLMMTEDDELRPRITVFGVGGAGGNAVNNMIEKQLDGVEFVVANTDAQALGQSRSEKRVQMGPKVTEGLGAGAKPAIGAAAAEETIEDIVDHLMGAHMCFITAGMGGGTGTGAAPIIAQAAREMGILTVGVVTKPFAFEGTRRMRQADAGIEALQKVVDTLIIIPNQNLFRLANERTTFTEAFALADDVLYQGVKGVTDLMVRPGLINLDFADVRAVMDEMGKAMMGTGEADGENRAVEAAEKAIANPLLDEISLTGAKGVLINITGGHDLTLFELDEAANIIRDKVDPDANIIVGSTLDEGMEGALRVSVVATGIEMSADEAAPPRRESAQVVAVAANPTASPAAAARTASPADDSVPARRTAPNPGPNPAAQPAAQQPATPARGDEAQHAARATGDASGSSMPAPAYAPRPAASALREQRLNDPATDFTAPMPGQGATEAGSAGTPRRLTDLAAKGGLGTATGSSGNAAAPASRGEAAPSGLAGGLGRIIGRMAHSAQDSHAGRPSASTVAERVSERVASNRARQDGFDDLADPDQGRDVTEVPAFLRRQAN